MTTASPSSLHLLDAATTESASLFLPDPSTTILLAEESWRQYVPLAVSVFVIIDILLGSPAANSILGIARAQEAANKDDSNSNNNNNDGTKKTGTGGGLLQVSTKGERIDSEQVANAAIERARNALEWNTEREKLKTDYDRMEDIRKKMDDQMREFDEKKKQST